MVGGVWQNLAGVILAPILLWGICLGFGLLVTHPARADLTPLLVGPIGFCAATAVALGVYVTGAGNTVAIPVLLLGALGGFLLARRRLRERLALGWVWGAALATFVIFDAAVLATGHWTIVGYDFNNDSAFELILVKQLAAHGTALQSGPPSTAHTVLINYLGTGYPLGSQSLLAVISGTLGVSAAAAWQSFISAVAALSALAAAALCAGWRSRRSAAFLGFGAVSSALVFAYAQQGDVKELACLLALLATAAALAEAIRARMTSAAVWLIGVGGAGILDVYNAAGLPFLGALLGWGAVAYVVSEARQRPGRRPRGVLGPGAVGLGALAILSLPALTTISTFFEASRSSFSASHPTAPPLGPLLRPLPLSQISGVWLYGDFRLPVPPGIAATITVAATVLVFALLVPGVARALSRDEPGPLLGLLTCGTVLLVVVPRVSPYVGGKLLMIASPLVMLVALSALTGMRRRGARVIARGAMLAIVVAALASDALAYHLFPVLSTPRMVALAQVGQRIGPRGPVLDSEFEQYAKVFADPARIIDGPDDPTPRRLALLTHSTQYAKSFDLNQLRLRFVESFPYVLVRRSPVASPPPANYLPFFANQYYEVFRRLGRPRVLAHLPLGGIGLVAGRRASCAAVGRLRATASPHEHLVLAQLPEPVGFPLTAAKVLPRDWLAPASAGGPFLTLGPGVASGPVDVPRTGAYVAWIAGSLPRRVEVRIDGRRIGSALDPNSPSAWLSAGRLELTAGRHVLAIYRPGGSLAPGDGDPRGEISAVMLAPAQAPRLTSIPIARWREACRRPASWIELVAS